MSFPRMQPHTNKLPGTYLFLDEVNYLIRWKETYPTIFVLPRIRIWDFCLWVKNEANCTTNNKTKTPNQISFS